MNDELRPRYETWVRELEALGHRGSATDHEARAADYLVAQHTALGLEARKEPFQGSRSAGLRVLVHVIVAALGAALLWTAPWLALVLGLLALVSLIGEFSTRFVLLGRLLQGAPSQNVVAVVPAASGRARRRIVVAGHYDTQRTGWIWNEALVSRLAPVLRRSPGPLKSPLFPVTLAMLMQLLAAFLTVVGMAGTLTSVLGGLALFIFAVAGVLVAQWGVGPFVPGASDNATGAAAVLAIGAAWRAAPRDDVELVLLQPGCEEVGLLGATAWAETHRDAVADVPTVFVNIDSLGYGRPRFLALEYALAGFPARYPPNLRDLAAEVAEAEKLVGAGPHPLPVPTDGLAFLMRGIPGLSVLSFNDDGHMPNYHQMTDTSDRLSFDVAWQCVRFCWALVQRLSVPLP
jgi:hypothetical protein